MRVPPKFVTIMGNSTKRLSRAAFSAVLLIGVGRTVSGAFGMEESQESWKTVTHLLQITSPENTLDVYIIVQARNMLSRTKLCTQLCVQFNNLYFQNKTSLLLPFDADVPLTLLDVSGTQWAFPDHTDCSKIPQRPIPMTVEKRSKMFMVLTENKPAISKVVESFEKTYVNCPADVRGGYLKNDNIVRACYKIVQ